MSDKIGSHGKLSRKRNVLLMVHFDRRKTLIIGDDPNFVPSFDLPALEFNDNGDLILPGVDISQRSKLYSQYSPLDQSSASPANAPLINLDIRRSSSQASLGIAPFEKEGHNPFDESIQPMFGDEEELPFADLGLTIDADGNFIEEPELPPHPVQQVGQEGEGMEKDHSDAHLPDDDAQIVYEEDGIQAIFGDEEQQAAAIGPVAQNHQNEVPLPSEEPLSSDPAQQPVQPRQQKKRKRGAMIADDATHVGRAEFRDWSTGYSTRIREARLMPHNVTVHKAKDNAYRLVFGMGIGDVGILNGALQPSHPRRPNHQLAELFSGEILMSRVPGFEEQVECQENRRRSASVAFGSEDEGGDDDRRVRPRVDEVGDAGQEQDQQGGRSQPDAQIDDDAMMILGDDQDNLPEAGRERAGSALSDHRRSSNAPWNRPSSAVPSSAGKNAEAGRHAVEGSPLVGRGSILQPLDAKFSDGGAAAFGSEGFAPMQADGAADFSSYSEFGAAAGVSTQEANTSQFMRNALDREGRNFLGFVERVATDRGKEDAEAAGQCWVAFDGLFEEQDKTKAVVAQAFLHVLTLATKNQIKVTQDRLDGNRIGGEIRVGVAVKSEQVNEADNMDTDVQGDEEWETAEE